MADRMPVVGALDAGDQPGLWICAGLGSRGLSFSVLCAELLAARMNAEPLPVEASLAKVLQPLRA
jgi:tRNA 5-methylaminomethyl-2-thiouridine biosynthesis bifunctional protein